MFQIGDKVSHTAFGEGTISSISKNGSYEVSVDFVNGSFIHFTSARFNELTILENNREEKDYGFKEAEPNLPKKTKITLFDIEELIIQEAHAILSDPDIYNRQERVEILSTINSIVLGLA